MTAISRTLATLELFEQIFSQLPARDLLLAQCVCKAWAATIFSSSILQTALFFRVSTSASAHDYSLNPLITSSFPFLLTPDRVLCGPDYYDYDIKFGALEHAPDPSPVLTTAIKAFQYSNWTLNPEAWSRPEASWRRMYVCNPPVVRINTLHSVRYRTGGRSINVATVELRAGKGSGYISCGGVRLDLKKEDGLKMGTLYDFLYDEICTGDEPRIEIAFSLNDGSVWDEIFAREGMPMWVVADEVVSGSMAETRIYPNVFRRRGEGGQEDGEVRWGAGGVTLSMKLRRYPRNITDDVSFPLYRSGGYRNVSFGPTVYARVTWE